MKATNFVTLIVLGLTTSFGASTPSHAQAVCPVKASQALEEAQKILDRGDQAEFDVALTCVVKALAQTRGELADLRDGRAPFTGQINAPKGFMITKPSVQEGR